MRVRALVKRGALAALLTALSACGGEERPATPAVGAGKEAASAAVLPAVATVAPTASAAAPPPDAGIEMDAGASMVEAPRALRMGAVATVSLYAAKNRKTKIGYLRPGASVTLRSAEPTPGPKNDGCASHRWYEVAPRGYACDDATVTRALDGEPFRALAWAGPRPEAFPFEYAFSTRAPMYGRVPDAREQKKAERRLRPVGELGKIKRSTAGHEDLAVLEPPRAGEPLPAWLADHRELPRLEGQKAGLVRKEIPYGSMLSFRHAFEAEGRTWLVTPELTLVPADRVRPFRPTAFHGVEVDEALTLPIGWFRRAPRPKYRREAGGRLVETSERWAPRTFVALTGTTIEEGGVTYHETRENGYFARESDLAIVAAPAELPRGVGPDDKWIDVSLRRGTLTLLVGKRVVFSTLMSPGAGGVTPSPSLSTGDLVRAALTPLGTYQIVNKHRAARMTSEESPNPEKFWIADVPWVQYFRNPFAIHASYWHEDFGMPKSGGCINLSPEDARRVFDWTEPQVPDDWAGAIAPNKDALGTTLVIRQ